MKDSDSPEKETAASRVGGGVDLEPSSNSRATRPRPKRIKHTRPVVFIMKNVLVPLIITGAFVALGAHLGANGPDAWYTLGVLWVAGQF
jgi:hypothetical protein